MSAVTTYNITNKVYPHHELPCIHWTLNTVIQQSSVEAVPLRYGKAVDRSVPKGFACVWYIKGRDSMAARAENQDD